MNDCIECGASVRNNEAVCANCLAVGAESMTDTPKRIWAFPKKDWFDAGASTSKITAVGAKDTEYHRADLSADLVRAGYLAGLEAVAVREDEKAAYWDEMCNDILRVEHQSDAKTIRAMDVDPEVIATIVAQVMEKKLNNQEPKA